MPKKCSFFSPFCYNLQFTTTNAATSYIQYTNEYKKKDFLCLSFYLSQIYNIKQLGYQENVSFREKAVYPRRTDLVSWTIAAHGQKLTIIASRKQPPRAPEISRRSLKERV